MLGPKASGNPLWEILQGFCFLGFLCFALKSKCKQGDITEMLEHYVNSALIVVDFFFLGTTGS